MRVTDGVVPLELVDKAWRYASEEAVWEFANGGDAADPLTSWVADIMNYFQDLETDGRSARWRDLGTSMPHLSQIWKAISNATPGK